MTEPRLIIYYSARVNLQHGLFRSTPLRGIQACLLNVRLSLAARPPRVVPPSSGDYGACEVYGVKFETSCHEKVRHIIDSHSVYRD